MSRLSLPDVTLCAVASVNVAATVKALQLCLEQAEFGAALLLSDVSPPGLDRRIEVKRIARINSAEAYSKFMLRDLAGHIATSHCLIAQWDGFILDSACWQREFLSYDYIGAPWPQFDDERNVGNGGFSLRSRRLLQLCRERGFHASHPEDVAICRRNRDFLDAQGIRIADAATASRFAYERGDRRPSFGFHGAFNLIPAVGAERFWEIYETPDDRTSVIRDWPLIVRQLARENRPLREQAKVAMGALSWRLRR